MITDKMQAKLTYWQENEPETYCKAFSAALDGAMARHGLTVDSDSETVYRPSGKPLTAAEFRNLLDCELWRLFPQYCKVGDIDNGVRFV